MKKLTLAIALSSLFAVSAVQADILSVTGPASTAGSLAAIIAAPASVLDDLSGGGTENTGQQGFDEQQDVLLTSALNVDGGGSIAAGTTVDSHMIFLNSAGNQRIDHDDVEWTFGGTILGVMSDPLGNLEISSSALLGASGTIYPDATYQPFTARGIEGNDGYTVVGDTLTLTMAVTEPGDWIRVITEASIDITEVPEPTSMAVFGLGLLGLGFGARRKHQAK